MHSPHYVMKNGLYLAYREETEFYEFDSNSDFSGHEVGGWYWTNDEDKAHVFMRYEDVRTFLARQRRSEFWKGAKEVKC